MKPFTLIKITVGVNIGLVATFIMIMLGWFGYCCITNTYISSEPDWLDFTMRLFLGLIAFSIIALIPAIGIDLIIQKYRSKK